MRVFSFTCQSKDVKCQKRKRVILFTHAGIPPISAKSHCRIAHGRFPVVTFSVSSVNARRNQSVSESKSRRLEHVTDTGVHVQFVARVFRKFSAQKRGNVFVGDDVLREVKVAGQFRTTPMETESITCNVATTNRLAFWNTSSSGHSGWSNCTLSASTLCHLNSNIPKDNSAGF